MPKLSFRQDTHGSKVCSHASRQLLHPLTLTNLSVSRRRTFPHGGQQSLWTGASRSISTDMTITNSNRNERPGSGSSWSGRLQAVFHPLAMGTYRPARPTARSPTRRQTRHSGLAEEPGGPRAREVAELARHDRALRVSTASSDPSQTEPLMMWLAAELTS